MHLTAYTSCGDNILSQILFISQIDDFSIMSITVEVCFWNQFNITSSISDRGFSGKRKKYAHTSFKRRGPDFIYVM